MKLKKEERKEKITRITDEDEDDQETAFGQEYYFVFWRLATAVKRRIPSLFQT